MRLRTQNDSPISFITTDVRKQSFFFFFLSPFISFFLSPFFFFIFIPCHLHSKREMQVELHGRKRLQMLLRENFFVFFFYEKLESHETLFFFFVRKPSRCSIQKRKKYLFRFFKKTRVCDR
ncbi:hypothetical protein PUN28_013257 [Cardiocondyla obscurior]|uniref:Transmembrane protein n=1 Tax=Cardiocondyla obscurior TaxID=286306 RepID=A0AAW2F7M7_9HYME